jgi:co-chaperonin GroES (HSP10)
MAIPTAKGPWVLLRVERKDRYGSIILPERQGPSRDVDGVGVVVSAGEGYFAYKDNWYAMPVQAGDRVAFRGFLRHAAILDEERDVCALHVQDVLAVVGSADVGWSPVSDSQG